MCVLLACPCTCTISVHGSILTCIMLQALFNIAGIAQYSDLETVTAEDLQRCFTVNAIGPILVVQSLLKEGVLQDQALIANMTSKVPGSAYATAMIQTASLQSTGSGPSATS